MAKCSRVILIQWHCLSVLLCILWPTVSFAANTPSPTRPVAPQNSMEPGAPPQSQVKTPNQPDSKGGEAAADASIAKLAVEMSTESNETVRRIEAFYANTVHDFEAHFSNAVTVISIIVAAMGSLVVAAVLLIAKQTAAGQANKALEPIRKWHSELADQSTQLADQSRQILSKHETLRQEYSALHTALQNERQEYVALRSKFTEVQDSALKNVRGLLMTTIAWNHIMNYMQNIDKASGEGKSKLDGLREEARKYIKQVLNEIHPTDGLVLTLTRSMGLFCTLIMSLRMPWIFSGRRLTT